MSERRLDATSALTLLSTVHGRDRRSLREIGKRDLQAAIKYGKKERTFNFRSGRRYGQPRWKYTFGDIVYITDETSSIEITSYVLPIEIHEVAVSKSDIELHEQAAAAFRLNPGSCTSHTLLVVDQSGSMASCDVEDFKTRSDAGFGSIALDLLGQQIDNNGSSMTDAVSLIEMRDYAVTVIDREPMTNVLFNKILRMMKIAKPSSHGNYIPALQEASRIMSKDQANDACALLLLFLSDGRPSDKSLPGMSPSMRINQIVETMAAQFRGQLTLGLIGFGGSQKDFGVLESMSEVVKAGGANSSFVYSGQSSSLLSSTLRTLGSQLSATRSRITSTLSLAQSRKSLMPRPVRSKHSLKNQLAVAAGKQSENEISSRDWWLYERDTVMKCWNWHGKMKGWVLAPIGRKFGLESDCCVAVHEQELGRGAERVVYELRHFMRTKGTSSIITPMGERLVAKESLFAEDDSLKREFHYIFCKTQQQASRFARKFNQKVAQCCALHRLPVPAILTFLDCTVYELFGTSEESYLAVLVEKMLDRSRWTKWNTNAGYVLCSSKDLQIHSVGQHKDHNHSHGLPLDLSEEEEKDYMPPKLAAIAEGSDSEGEHDEDSGSDEHLPETHDSRGDALAMKHSAGYVYRITSADFPQAFSHWSFRYSKRQCLVCDLQGTLDESVNPAVFELTDPVIHFASNHGRRRVFGRTDLGKKGVHRFFESHQCNGLCRLLGLPTAVNQAI